MDSYNKENYLKKYEDKSLDKLQSKVIFNNPVYLFIFKKTERVIAAIYLITNLISDNEPIKIIIRQQSLKVMSDVVALKQTPSAHLKQSLSDLMISLSQIISLIKVATIADQISSMNGSIVQQEFSSLLMSLDGLNTETIGNGSVMLPQDFFNIPEPVVTAQNFHSEPAISHKGQYRTSATVKDNKSQQTMKDTVSGIKDNRKEAMLRLLAGGKSLGIKDFAKEIKGCSEKTIQRELLTLVEKGVLKKTGERRWSVYSLV